MTQPRVLLCSMWREDAWKSIGNRVRHLLAKAETYANVRFLWVVGDSRDETAAVLRELTAGNAAVTIIEMETGIAGEDTESRLRRLSLTANVYLKNVLPSDDLVVIHESDLLTPPDLVNRFVADAERGICPVAAWPIINLVEGVVWCYDVWALRKDGARFTNGPPYHQAYQADRVFSVDSFGSVFMFHAEDAPHVHMDKRAVLDLCWHLRERGRTLWVDPEIVAEQPLELFTFRAITEEYA